MSATHRMLTPWYATTSRWEMNSGYLSGMPGM